MTIQPGELSDAVKSTLENASKELKEKVNKAAVSSAKNGAKRLREVSPEYSGDRKDLTPGDYKQSWTSSKKKSAISGSVEVVIYNKKHYRLTHLLEFGHVNRDGTRARAMPHIADINNEVCEEFERKVERAIHDL